MSNTDKPLRLVPTTFGELPVGAEFWWADRRIDPPARKWINADGRSDYCVVQVLPAELSMSSDLARRVLALLKEFDLYHDASEQCEWSSVIAELEALCAGK